MKRMRQIARSGITAGTLLLLGVVCESSHAAQAFNLNTNPLSPNAGSFFRSGVNANSLNALNGFNGLNRGSGINGFNGLNGVQNNFNGLFNAQGNLDFTANIPQSLPNFSRVQAVNNLNVGNIQEINTRAFVNDPNSGLAAQQVRINPFRNLFDPTAEVLESRSANALGNRAGNFLAGGIDNAAKKEAEKFLLESLVGKTVNNVEKRLKGFNNQEVFEIASAVALSKQVLGPDLARGVGKIQCEDIMMTAVNNEEGATVDKAYANLSPEDRCVALASQALNHLKPFGKPIVQVNASMIRNGILTIPNLLNTFSLPALAVIFKKGDNTNICNFEQAPGNPVWSLSDLVTQVMNPQVYNLAKGYDLQDVNRNLFLETGVNLALPRQFMGALGVQAGLFASNATDIGFINGRESGVGKSGLTREIRAWANNAGRAFFTFDPNGERSGVQLASQSIIQTGKNNLGFGQGEGYRVDPFGSFDWFLTAAPDADGKIAVANEVPASAAHTSAILAGSTSVVISAGQCIQCHLRGTKTNSGDGVYTPLNIAGTNGVGGLSANFSNAMAQYENFKKLTRSYIPDPEKGGSKDILWDAYQKIKMPKSIDYAANQLGLSGDQLRGMMNQDPSLAVKLQLNEKGNIDTPAWLGGGKCGVKFALSGKRGGNIASGALASTAGPGATIAVPKDPEAPKGAESDEQPHS